MQIEERIVTVLCSAKDCGNKGIAAGQTAKVDLVMQGWKLDLEIFHRKIDLCPECKWELHEWSGIAAIETAERVAHGMPEEQDEQVVPDDEDQQWALGEDGHGGALQS